MRSLNPNNSRGPSVGALYLRVNDDERCGSFVRVDAPLGLPFEVCWLPECDLILPPIDRIRKPIRHLCEACQSDFDDARYSSRCVSLLINREGYGIGELSNAGQRWRSSAIAYGKLEFAFPFDFRRVGMSDRIPTQETRFGSPGNVFEGIAIDFPPRT